MSFLKFSGIGIAGLAGAVPANTINNIEYTQYFPADQVKDIVEKTGIRERRFAPEHICSSDLCYAAAEKLLQDLHVDRNEIDLIIFVSQTPDYRMPATSVILQHKLGLANHAAAFDLSLGCSGFVYGLSVAYTFMQQPSIRKVLVLDGETRSRIYSPKDRQTAFLFGDGGVAALLEKDAKFGDAFFSLNSDGSRESLIKVDAGGYRNPSTVQTLTEKVVDEYGNIRTDEHGYMNGADVFNFVLREIPGDISNLLSFANKTYEFPHHFIFHQANAYMNNYLVRKLKIDKAKVPSSVEKFGNTSSVSIPLTIVSELSEDLNLKVKDLLLCGFGVGMSWATALLKWNLGYVAPLVEVE